VGKDLPFYTAQYTGKAQNSSTSWRKSENTHVFIFDRLSSAPHWAQTELYYTHKYIIKRR